MSVYQIVEKPKAYFWQEFEQTVEAVFFNSKPTLEGFRIKIKVGCKNNFLHPNISCWPTKHVWRKFGQNLLSV